MSLIRYRPTTLSPWFTDFDRFFDEAFAPMRAASASKETEERPWAPAVDVREDNQKYLITADLPGVDQKDVEVKLDDGRLTISGERNFEKTTDEENYHRVERSYGSFSRTFTVPDLVDSDNIDAKYANGVLTLTLPKVAEAPKKKRTISVS